MASVVLRARFLFVFFLAIQTFLWSYSRYANGFVSRHTSHSYSSGLGSRSGTGTSGGTIGGLLLKRSNTDATLNLDTTIGTTNDSSVDEAGEGGGEEGECAPLTVPASDQCTHVLTHCPTSQTVLSIPYLQTYFCSPLPTRPIIFLTLLTWLLFLFTTLGISSSDFFCPNLSTLSSLLRLDENLAGVTFLAFGNGSPDLFGTYTAMRAGAGELAVGELMGAASFIVSVVVGTMCIVRPFRVERGKFWRDTGFLAGAVGSLVGILWDGRVERWEAAGLVGIYGVYVGVVVVGSWWERRVERRMRMRVYEPPEEEVQVFEPYRDEPIPNTPSDYLTIPPFQSRERSHSSPASPHSHSLGLGLRLDVGGGGTDGGAYPLTNQPQSQSQFLSRSRSGSSSRSISPSLTPTPTSPTLVSHQFSHLTFPSHHHGRSPYHQQGHTGQKEHIGHHHRSVSTQQMPSFSLVGAIEFRDVVASLREQSAASGTGTGTGSGSNSGSGFATTGNIEFESPGLFVGGHYHSYRLNSFGSGGSGSGSGGHRDSHISNGSHISGGRKSPLLSRRNTGSVKGFDRSHSRGSVSGTGGAGGGSRNGSRNGSARGSMYSDIVPLRERSPLSKSIELEEAGATSGPSGSGSGFAATTSGGPGGANAREGEGSEYNEVRVPRVPRIATTPASPDPSEVSLVDGDGDENGDEDEVLGLFSPTDIATGGNGRSLSRWRWRNGRENGRKERREWKVGVKMEEVRRVAGEVGHVLFPTLYGLFGSGSVSSLETESLTQSEGESGSGTGNRKEVESRGGKGSGNGKVKKRKSWLGVVFSILAAPAVLALTLTLPVCVTPRVCEKEDCVGAGSGSIGNRVEGDLGEVERGVGAGVPEGRLIEIEVENGREGTGEEERLNGVDVERGRPTIAGAERTRGQGETGEGMNEAVHRGAEIEGEQREDEQERESGGGEGEIQLEIEMGDEVGFNKWLMAAQLVLGPLFCVFVLFSGSGSGSDSDVAGVSNGFINAFVTSGTGNGYGLWFWVIFGITGLLGLGMALMVIKFADKGDNVVGQIARTFMGFFVAVVWIMVIADEVVNVLKTFGFIFGLSDAIIGLTIFAVGNSLADFVANVSVAAFAPIMGFSACFGGPMLNILLGVGVSGLVVTSSSGSGGGEPYELDFSSTLAVSSVGLLVLLGATLVVVPMSGYELTRRWGVVLVCSYVVIMAVNVVVEARTGRG